MNPAHRKQCDITGAQDVLPGPGQFQADFSYLDEMDSPKFRALREGRGRIRRDISDVMSA
jgi:hypothetical protein